jgi:hypothetical protein
MLIPGITASTVQDTGFVEYVDHETNTSNTGTSLVVNVPNTTGANFLLAYFVMDDQIANVSTPSGWTLITAPSCLVTLETRLWYRVVDNEPASYDFTTNTSGVNRAAGIVSISNVDTADPFDDWENGSDCAGNATSFDLDTALSVTESGVSIFSFCGLENPRTLTAPTGYTQAWNVQVTPGGPTMGLAYDEDVSTGSHNPAWTVDTSLEGTTAAVALNYSAT